MAPSRAAAVLHDKTCCCRSVVVTVAAAGVAAADGASIRGGIKDTRIRVRRLYYRPTVVYLLEVT